MAALVALVAAIVVAPGAQAQGGPPVPVLDWQPCDASPDAPDVHFECASAAVPLDYAKPDNAVYHVALVRKEATNPGKKLGSLFVNYGGPGAGGTDSVEADFLNPVIYGGPGLYDTLNQQYDIIGFDPRGTGRSDAALDCQANQETQGIYSIPYATPDTERSALLKKDRQYVRRCVQLNKPLLPYVTTGNVARDLDLLRQAVGDTQLNYLGFSYGTFLGATYGALFPGNLGRVVLDGPVDADDYINHPTADLQAQTSAFERELDRFFQACASDQDSCYGFGGDDPHAAFDALVEQANANPIPVSTDNPWGWTADTRAVTGDDILNATIYNLYRKEYWSPYIAQELRHAADGDGSGIRMDSDGAFGYDPETGTYAPDTDRYFLIGAVEQRYPDNNDRYFRLGKSSYNTFDHFWFNSGYVELNYGLFPVGANGRYGGPFTLPDSANTPLVVATTYDPATPYRGAKALVKDLGNARLLTMIGDGHTAYNSESACVNAAVDGYLLGGALPPAGTVCKQDTTFSGEEPTSDYTPPSLAPQAQKVGGKQRPLIRTATRHDHRVP
ncbi:Carboxylesterase A [Baekduia alba]|uniref:alpha/beta hydrolase n=1 Tax=Baekduia alba TaxID=2997333 RepID=UPI00234159F3|nr:alpha/beta hydrolase [Baekduia alba]WCB94049.1 Carboxylesterase A [Baekduia alba]